MASFVDGNKCVMALQVVQTTNLRQSSRFIIAPYVEEAMSTKSDVISAKKKKKVISQDQGKVGQILRLKTEGVSALNF